MFITLAMGLTAVVVGACWIGLVGWMRHARGVNETISSLLLTYIAIAIVNFFIEGVLRNPADPNRPSTKAINPDAMVGAIPGLHVHWGLAAGVVLAVLLYLLMDRTTFGFAARIAGGNPRVAEAQGLSVVKLIVTGCFVEALARASLASSKSRRCMGARACTLGVSQQRCTGSHWPDVQGGSRPAALFLRVSVNGVRLAATSIGGLLAGIGGAFLSLSYPGSWNEGLSSGQGLMAVALVIFARWDPVHCFYAAVLFGAAGAIEPALQSIAGRDAGLLFLQCGALHPDAAADGCLRAFEACGARHAARTGDHAMTLRTDQTGPGRAIGLDVSGVSKMFGSFVALKGVDLKVPAASFPAMLGENGAGKTTQVRCITGYYHPDHGKIAVDGHAVTIASPRDASNT